MENLFNGIYTYINTVKGTHRTFKIHTVKRGNLKGKRLVSLLSGPDNNSSYQAFAFVNEYGITAFRKHQHTQYESYARMIQDVALQGENSIYIQKGLEVKVEKRCLRCNRRLTHPESLKTGIGPECIKSMGI
jgi:hypothetical protein